MSQDAVARPDVGNDVNRVMDQTRDDDPDLPVRFWESSEVVANEGPRGAWHLRVVYKLNIMGNHPVA